MDLPTHTLTISDLVAWLRISRVTIYKWMKYENFPYKIINKKRRFKQEEILAWFDQEGELE